MTETITPKLAIAASSAGITPGRRRISLSGAASVVALVSRSGAIRSAITFVSGRTVSASPQVTSDRPAAASHGTVSVSAATSLPANSGPKSAGPRTAPKTEPKRTYEIPRARRSGGYMSPAAVLIEERHRSGDPGEREACDERDSRAPVGANGSEAVADRAEEETDDDHRDAAEAVHGAPGREGGQRRGCQEDRGARAEQRPESGHERRMTGTAPRR